MRPCPYCGSTDVYLARTFGAGCTVACPDCGMSGPESKDGIDAEALEAWDILCKKMCRKCNVNLIQSNKELRHEIESLKASLRMRS